MLNKYLSFIRRASTTGLGKGGVILTTSSFIALVLLELARMLGLVTNAYVGLVTYLLFPFLFVVGLLLIPLGWYRLRKKTGLSTRRLLEERFGPDETRGSLTGSRLFRFITLLTVINVFFLVAISTQMLGFMDSSYFCGTACHSVMNPEWVTYQQSPHARVRCVQCHVGEGAEALIDSKLNGLWQIISVTFNLYERPIPTPVRQLRPARETCEKCHWPEKFYGSHLVTRYNYQNDDESSLLYTTLNLKIDAGKAGEKAGIHWHIGQENEVRYTSVGDRREMMLWVEARRPDGRYHRFYNRNATAHGIEDIVERSMDCVDCHNRATHIYEEPERAVDDRIKMGLLDLSLPYLKREALAAITSNYADSAAAYDGIGQSLRNFYMRNYPELSREKTAIIDSAVMVLQDIYSRNIHKPMNIRWNTYASHIGHKGNTGCFRCHNPALVDSAGAAISYDCTLCHSILADNHKEPFQFLEPAETGDRDYQRHRYLKDEFLNSFKK